jgi:hypothetical protein
MSQGNQEENTPMTRHEISDTEVNRICEYVEAQTNPFAGNGAFQGAQALFVEVWENTDWWTDENNA